MSGENVLETVKKSIKNYCHKQMMNPSKKEFILILDNNKDEKITFIGIRFVMSLIKKVFNYELSANFIDVIDPDDRGLIISLMQGSGYNWQITYNSQGED